MGWDQGLRFPITSLGAFVTVYYIYVRIIRVKLTACVSNLNVCVIRCITHKILGLVSCVGMFSTVKP